MNTPVTATRSPHLLMWIAGIAVILFSVAGIAAIMGWIPTSMGRGSDSAEVGVPGTLATNAAAQDAARPQAAARPSAAPAVMAERGPARHRCADCGVIESTRAVKSKGTGTGVGAVGGAVVGGAVAGNEVEKRVKSTTGYEVSVRLDDGSSRVVNEGSRSAWHNGDHVKIVSGEIQANP